MRNYILFLLALFLCVNTIKGQILAEKRFYPEVKTIKSIFFNGSGGSGYWSLERLDSLGRIIESESYRKKELLSKEQITYNSYNDQLHNILTFNINSPNEMDTIVKYEYKYDGDRIIYQKSNDSKNDSTIVELVENRSDTLLVYNKCSYFSRPNSNRTDEFEEKHILTYKNNLLSSFEIFKFTDGSRTTTYFTYYPDGKLKRKKIERNPQPEVTYNYLGGEGGDDMYYEYKLDKEGRVKILYHLINGRKIKIAEYDYK